MVKCCLYFFGPSNCPISPFIFLSVNQPHVFYLSISVSICIPIFLSFYLSYNQLFSLYVVYLSIFITAFFLSSYHNLPYCPSIYPSWCLPIYLPICLSISIYLLSIYPLPGRLWILTSGIFVVLGVTSRSFFLGGSCGGASAPLASCARHNCLKKFNCTWKF